MSQMDHSFLENLRVLQSDQQTGNFIMHNPETGQKFGLKEISIDSEKYKDYLYFLSEREKISSKYIINLHTTIQQPQNDSLAIIFENWVLNFHDQLVHRCRTDQFWTEEELVNTLETTIQGILTLHESGIYHGNLSTQSIVFCEDSNVKIVDQFVFSQKYVLEDLEQIKQNYFQFPHFLEPQLLIDEESEFISNTSIENDLWAVGMIFLQAATLELSTDLYDYPNNQFNFEGLEARLKMVQQKYSLQFYWFLAMLLSLDRNQRVHFIIKIQSIDDFSLYSMFEGEVINQVVNDHNSHTHTHSHSHNQLKQHQQQQQQQQGNQYQQYNHIKQNDSQIEQLAQFSNLNQFNNDNCGDHENNHENDYQTRNDYMDQLKIDNKEQEMEDDHQNKDIIIDIDFQFASDEYIYKGELQNNKRTGLGLIYLHNQLVCQGQFVNNKLNGIARLFNPVENDWISMEVNFVNNVLNGPAVLHYDSQTVYGQFHKGVMKGVKGIVRNGQYLVVKENRAKQIRI